jgi:hypothetical protein
LQINKRNPVEIGDENCMVSGRGVVKMYYFAIDFDAETPYPLAPPQGWEEVQIFDNKQLATSNWQLAGRRYMG